MRKERNFICLECSKSFVTREKKSKFCTQSCSAKNMNKNKESTSKEHKEKISLGLKKWWNERSDKIEKRIQIIQHGKTSQVGKHKTPKSILELSKRTVSKICKRLELKCSRCNWNEDVCDIHHIKPRSEGGLDDHSNLCYLCPNCHRLAGNKKIKIEDLITLDIYIKDTWLEYYYG